MADTPTSLELRPPPPPEPLLPQHPDIPVWVMVTAAAAFLVIVVLVVVLSRRKKPVDPTALRKQAYRDALRTLDEARPPAAREAATIASLVLRRYLAIVSGDPALFETHEEFIGRHDSLSKLPEAVRAATIEGFDRLAAMKYGKTTSADEPATILAPARVLLDQLNHAFTA